MANRISINYTEAEEIVSELNKGITDMETNVEALVSKTNSVIGIEWIGKDADATKGKMDDAKKRFDQQIEALKTITNNIKGYIARMHRLEEDTTKATGSVEY